MLTISRTSRFKRDFKRIEAGHHGKELDRIFADVFALLVFGKILPPRYRDHSLLGDYEDCRECHLKPDLLLIYRILDGKILQLTRLDSYSELF